MASSDTTWRNHPFERGVIYVAQESFESPGRARVGYSHYDNTTFFRFVEQGRSEVIIWTWHDDEPDPLCQTRFKALARDQ